MSDDLESSSNGDDKWHLQKGVPISLIIAIMLQTAGAAWWASGVSTRIDYLEHRAQIIDPQIERTARLEERVNTIQLGIVEIKQLIKEIKHP